MAVLQRIKDIPVQEAKELPYSNCFLKGVFGPAMVLLAFGQATGELIHWPNLIAKYGTFFLFAIIPACLLQFPIFSFLARHTIVTGETFLSTLLKANKYLAILVWVTFFFTALWISSYTAAGGVSIVKLLNAIFGLSIGAEMGATIAALVLNTIFFLMLWFRGRTYRLVSTFMTWIAGISFGVIFFLFVWSLTAHGFRVDFFSSLFSLKNKLPIGWSPADGKLLISAIVFAGLGGLWNILYSSWVRNAGMGMAADNRDEYVEYQRRFPSIEGSNETLGNYGKNMRLLHSDLLAGLGLNAMMLIMLSYITFVNISPGSKPPAGLDIVTTLADSASTGVFAVAALFYVMLFVFLVDTWLAAADSLSKVHSNFLIGLIAGSRPNVSVELEDSKLVYKGWLTFIWVMTFATSFVAQPQQLIFLGGILSALGSVLLILGLFENERKVAKLYPWIPKAVGMKIGLAVSFGLYVLLALGYFLSA